MALKGAGKRLLQAAVDDKKEFRSSSTSARWEHGKVGTTGQLPEYWQVLLSRDMAREGKLFVIYSYETPIAWLSESISMWMVPPVRYSTTTTNHQNVVTTAIVDPGFYTNA